MLGSDNVFYPDIRLGFEWVDDSTFAYLKVHGSGCVLLPVFLPLLCACLSGSAENLASRTLLMGKNHRDYARMPCSCRFVSRFETNSMSRVQLNGLFTIVMFDLRASPKKFNIYSVVSLSSRNVLGSTC